MPKYNFAFALMTSRAWSSTERRRVCRLVTQYFCQLKDIIKMSFINFVGPDDTTRQYLLYSLEFMLDAIKSLTKWQGTNMRLSSSPLQSHNKHVALLSLPPIFLKQVSVDFLTKNAILYEFFLCNSRRIRREWRGKCWQQIAFTAIKLLMSMLLHQRVMRKWLRDEEGERK